VCSSDLLFSRNIIDNIRLDNTSLGLEEVESVAQSVHSHHFINNLPFKYEQELIERGSSLSMGQRQLLSFARALAFDPRILILDEATSNVDTETERQIQNAIQELMEGRTSIIIAHRLSTLKTVDKVLVLKQGKVQEFGTRQELLRNKGTYYNLLKLQVELSERDA
jgi:ABC-type multidrug transport system fused ATPase/permease subunit